jgi:hypothetical protein
MMTALTQKAEIHMKALRGLFFLIAATAGCFSDNSVQKDIAKVARVVVAISGVLFVIAEAMELMS